MDTARWTALGCTVREQEPMAAHTSFHIGGAATVFVTAPCAAVATVVRDCRAEGIPCTVIGNGTNLLVSDGGVDGVVVRIVSDGITVDGTVITAEAGVSLTRLCRTAAAASLTGLEFAYGIPGTLGGGLFMNAGAYGGELAAVCDSVTVLDPNGEEQILTAAQMDFGYRHSALSENGCIALRSTLRLARGNETAIRKTMDELLHRRQEKQPLEYPSAGSYFKRPKVGYAAAMIEECGLKGLCVGDAAVSEKHAGFVINRGKATCAQVLELEQRVREAVQTRFGVSLEREVQWLGRR